MNSDDEAIIHKQVGKLYKVDFGAYETEPTRPLHPLPNTLLYHIQRPGDRAPVLCEVPENAIVMLVSDEGGRGRHFVMYGDQVGMLCCWLCEVKEP